MTSTHSCRLSASKPHDNRVKREQNPRYRHNNGLIRLKAAGRDTSDAERRLRLFQSNLRRFEEHRNQLRQMTQLTRHPLIKSFLSALDERRRADNAAMPESPGD